MGAPIAPTESIFEIYYGLKTFDEILRLVAYSLWEKALRPKGLQDYFWYQAEQLARDEGFDPGWERAQEVGWWWSNSPE